MGIATNGRTEMSSRSGYKIRSYTNGKSKQGTQYKNYALTVPNEIAEAIPADMTFIPRMTDEGLLYEPSEQAQMQVPKWAKNGGTEKKTTRRRRSEKAAATSG